MVELVEARARLTGFNCRSNAVVLTAFYSSPVRRGDLSVKVSAMRKFVFGTLKQRVQLYRLRHQPPRSSQV